MAQTGYINPDVAKMYGIPYHKLTAKQKKILHEDSIRRAKLIKERQEAVMRNNLKAFTDEAKMEKVLGQVYTNSQKQILADITETIAKVQKAGGTWSYANASALTRSKGLFEQIGEEIKKLGQTEENIFYKGLGNIYTDQFQREVYELGQTMIVKANFNRLNPALVRKTLDYPWSGAMFSDRIWNDKATLGVNLRIGLTQSMILGEDISQITDRVNRNINTSRYNAERLARTETKRVCYVAHDDVMEDCGVEEVRYMCANSALGMDKRVCKVCREFDGKVFKRGEEPTLPIHPNCRCWYVPEVSDTFMDNELNELTHSTRGAENYEKWQKAQQTKVVEPVNKPTVQKSSEKYDKALAQLDTEYKDKDSTVSGLKANLKQTEDQYKSYDPVRRGEMDPKDAGFDSRAMFESNDRELLANLKDIKTNLDKSLNDLQDLMMDKQYLIQAGAGKVDTLADYRNIRSALKKNATFDYSKYGDELRDTIASMDAEEISLQSAFYKNGSTSNWRGLTPKEVFKDGAISNVRLSLRNQNIAYMEVNQLNSKLTTEEIINKIGGGDLTHGSCSSLAFSYAGNKVGLDVTDYRGGDSQYFFSMPKNIREIANLPGVVSFVEEDINDIKGVNRLLEKMEKGKEYYLSTGRHVAIVKKTDKVEYLELQTERSNGYKELTTDVLRNRFGCKLYRSFQGKRYAVKNDLIDINSLADNSEFQKILGYINTNSSKQKKGGRGYAK